MKSLRAKLILFVVAICLFGIGSIIVYSLHIVRNAQREQTKISNRQVSELISTAISSRVGEYERQLNYVFKAWKLDPAVVLQPGLFPDVLWIKITSLQGNHQSFEWANTESLGARGFDAEGLIGYKSQQELVDEAKFKFRKPGDWLIYNSTNNPLHPTFVLATGLYTEGSQDMAYVGIAEIASEKLYQNIKGRRGQNVTLVDSHQNIMLSTLDGWDPSEIVYDDQSVLKILSNLKDGESSYAVIDYSSKESQVSSIFRFSQGGGLSVVLQEGVSKASEIENNILINSLIAALIILFITEILIILFSNSITGPMSELMRLMERVGKGEFTGKILVKSKDEIGRLANIFNKMLQDLKQRDQEIENAKARLIQSEKMSAFGQMSAGIAHEVKNPLAGILGYAQMSKKKLTPDSPVIGYLDIIEKETVRCKEIVENLMRFARQEKASMMRIDINRTVKDSIRLVEHQLGISGIKLVQMFAIDGAPIWISGNANQIQQVMMNLLLNAQQAMESKGTITVSTHFSPETQRVLVMVSDTGAGMPPDVKARIFEPFFTTKGVGKGTGLGLAVTIGIIKDHGGTIDVDSTPGKGTTFTIGLPCQSNQSEPAKEVAA